MVTVTKGKVATKTATRTATRTTASNADLKWYTEYFNNWPKLAGPKPTAAEFALAHKYLKPGAKHTLAAAMYLRATGATRSQVILGVGNPQYNKCNALVQSGLLDWQPCTQPGNAHHVYKLALPAKAAKAAKGKGKGKAASVTAKAAKAAQPAKAAKAASVTAKAAQPSPAQAEPSAS